MDICLFEEKIFLSCLEKDTIKCIDSGREFHSFSLHFYFCLNCIKEKQEYRREIERKLNFNLKQNFIRERARDRKKDRSCDEG
jgi:hypothetical protein